MTYSSNGMGGNGSGLGGNANSQGGWGNVNWSDPNYWTAWNGTVSSLLGTVGQGINTFSPNGQQAVPTQNAQQQQKNNTTMLVVGAIALVLLLVIIVYLISKK